MDVMRAFHSIDSGNAEIVHFITLDVGGAEVRVRYYLKLSIWMTEVADSGKGESWRGHK